MHIHAHHGDNRATPLGNDKALTEIKAYNLEGTWKSLYLKNTTPMFPYVRPNAIFTPSTRTLGYKSHAVLMG